VEAAEAAQLNPARAGQVLAEFPQETLNDAKGLGLGQVQFLGQFAGELSFRAPHQGFILKCLRRLELPTRDSSFNQRSKAWVIR